MDVQHKLITLEEFETFLQLPENASRIFELIDGEIVEKTPSNPLSSKIAMPIALPIGNYWSGWFIATKKKSRCLHPVSQCRHSALMGC